MTPKKENCWEYKKCGRDPDGNRINELDICPVAKDFRLDKVHGGLNAGRSCLVLVGTFCEGKVQGTFAEKYKTCMDCNLYKKVLVEEGNKFELTVELIKCLKKS